MLLNGLYGVVVHEYCGQNKQKTYFIWNNHSDNTFNIFALPTYPIHNLKAFTTLTHSSFPVLTSFRDEGDMVKVFLQVRVRVISSILTRCRAVYHGQSTGQDITMDTAPGTSTRHTA